MVLQLNVFKSSIFLDWFGLCLDSQMTWQAHINALAGKINRSLGILNRLIIYRLTLKS